MHIIDLTAEMTDYTARLSQLLAQVFPQAYADSGDEQVVKLLQKDRIALAAIEEGALIGFVGAIPVYDAAWELHPLLVDPAHQRRDAGAQLVAELERRLIPKGCLTVYLGSDDEDDATTLSNTDLFVDTFDKIRSIRNLKGHAYEFYQKQGYQIVGVLPDANGVGKPDIWIAKSLRKNK